MTINIENQAPSDKKITYNFYTVPLNSDTNSITNNVSMTSDSYIKITKYPYNGKAPHIQHDIFGNMREFIVTEMRIYNGIYNNSNLELVIETSSPSQDITYVCIPLKSAGAGTSANDLDTTIQSMCLSKPDLCPPKLNLNTLIPKQGGITYLVKTGDDKKLIFDPSKTAKNMCILIFNNAIPIVSETTKAADSASIKNLTINVGGGSGDSDGAGYKVIKRENITSSEGLSASNIYIDCNGDEGDGVTKVLGGRYKLNEKDIQTIFWCFFVGLILTLVFYVCDKLNQGENPPGFLVKMFCKLRDLYDENKNVFLKLNGMIWVIIINFLLCFSLYVSSFLSKTRRVELLISAIYFTMTLFLFIYVKFLKSVIDPTGKCVS